MDKLDYKILNILKENGRETASDISKAIHLSVSAVLDRIKKMEESGINQGLYGKGGCQGPGERCHSPNGNQPGTSQVP